MPIDGCPGCGGVWLDHHELKRVVEARGIVRSAGAKGRPVATEPQVDCPLCHAPMERFNFKQSSILLDRCAGHGTWLDAGELERVVAAAAVAPQPGPKVTPKAPDKPPPARTGRWSSGAGLALDALGLLLTMVVELL